METGKVSGRFPAIRPKSVITFTARIFLGSIFIWAAVGKIADPQAFANAIHHYRVVPPIIVNPVAVVLPWLELFCGLCLLAGLWMRASALWLSLMALVFTGLVGTALYRGIDITCGCFGADEAAQKIGLGKLAQNIALFVSSIWISMFPQSPFSLEKGNTTAS